MLVLEREEASAKRSKAISAHTPTTKCRPDDRMMCGPMVIAHHPRILMVEDSAATMKFQKGIIERALQRHGIDSVKIDVARDGREAVSHVTRLSDVGESYLLITMDLAMPILDGVRATENVRVHAYRGSTTPIVALSCFDNGVPPLDAEQLKPYVFCDLIPKPLTNEGASLLVSSFVLPRIVENSPGSLILAAAVDEGAGAELGCSANPVQINPVNHLLQPAHISDGEAQKNKMETRRLEVAVHGTPG